MNLFPKICKLPKITNSSNKYVILKVLLNKNLLFGYRRRTLCFCSNLRSILLTWQFRGAISSKASPVCHIMVYGSNFLKKQWQQLIFFQNKYEKHDDHTMIVLRTMTTIPRNMAAMPSSWHNPTHVSPWSWHGSLVFQPRDQKIQFNEENIKIDFVHDSVGYSILYSIFGVTMFGCIFIVMSLHEKLSRLWMIFVLHHLFSVYSRANYCKLVPFDQTRSADIMKKWWCTADNKTHRGTKAH